MRRGLHGALLSFVVITSPCACGGNLPATSPPAAPRPTVLPGGAPTRASSSLSAASDQVGAGRDWPVYLGHKTSNHYSTLNQINKDNVARLQVAWTYETGDTGEFQSNNLIIDGVLYSASPARNVVALNAATGKEIWRFDPKSERDDIVGNRQRGLVYWARGNDRRVFTSAGSWLYALGRTNRSACPQFWGERFDPSGTGDGPRRHAGDPTQYARRDLQGSVDHGRPRQRTDGGRVTGVRRANGTASMGLPHDSATR